MNRDEQRESRTILRRVEAHLRQSHTDMGTQEETIGFVDVLHHPQSQMPMLNYVTPRKNTAWVSSNHIEQGLEILTEKNRTRRVRFAEGLYPPVFASNLRDLGLEIEQELPLMVYKKQAKPRKLASYPEDIQFSQARTPNELAIWWYVWRNAYYDVAVSGVEPLLIGRDIQDVYMKRQINLIMSRSNYPIGVIRLTLHEDTAHLVAHAILKEMRTPQWEKLLQQVALDTAMANGADMLFAIGKTDDERTLYRDVGFMDAGNIITYADNTAKRTSKDSESDSLLEQSILVV